MIYGKDLKAYIEANPKLAQARESVRYPGLRVIKYKRHVFFSGCWTSVLQECRGLVVDADYNPVVVPFTKLMNRFERGTDIHRDMSVVAIRKVNGFMAAATRVHGHGWIISTTGSLDSEFCDLARKWLPESALDKLASGIPDKQFTWLFEIVDPSDPHIIPEEAGAYLIGMRFIKHNVPYYSNDLREDLMDRYAAQAGFKRPEWQKFDRFSDLTGIVKDCKHEGYCVYGDNISLKIKSPYYLVKKLFARMNVDKLVKMLDNPNLLRERLEEESYPLIDYLNEHRDTFVALEEQARLEFIRAYFEEVNG